jgi:serine/threonine-protein kinase
MYIVLTKFEVKPMKRTWLLVDRYRIVCLIGRGGSSTVHLANDMKSGEKVAVKVLRGERSGNSHAMERFALEARVAARLDHPGICPILDNGLLPDGRPFLVMPYLAGSDLSRIIAQGPLPEARVLELLASVLDALAAAHENGIIHRDLKPSNIMVLPDDKAQVLDFGVSKLRDAAGITNTGCAVGTAVYMAPEQALGMNVDHRCDIYAVGVVAYEAATGVRPFGAAGPGEVLDALLHGKAFPTARMRKPALSKSLDSLIRRAMSRDPWTRFSSAAEMRYAMLAAINQVSSGADNGKRSLATTTAELELPDVRPRKRAGQQ